MFDEGGVGWKRSLDKVVVGVRYSMYGLGAEVEKEII